MGPIWEMAEISLLAAAFCKGKLCSGNNPQPQSVIAQERSACLFLTWHCVPHIAKEGLGCLWLGGALLFGG